MKLLKRLGGLKPEHQLLIGIAIIVILSSLFWRSPSPFSMGAQAHLGNLKGKVEFEAFDDQGFSESDDVEGKHDDRYIYRNKAFVLFYVPWCGYCKNVMPIWDQLTRKYQQGDVNIMKMDCEKFTNLSKKHEVESYPTIRLYPNGLQDNKNYITYVDSRDLNSFQRFLDEHSNARVGYVDTQETFQNASNYNSPVGYNDYEIFEPFHTDPNDVSDSDNDGDAGYRDRKSTCYKKFMAGGDGGPVAMTPGGKTMYADLE